MSSRIRPALHTAPKQPAPASSRGKPARKKQGSDEHDDRRADQAKDGKAAGTKARISRLLSFLPTSQDKPRVDARRVLAGITFIDRNGFWRRDVPRKHGPSLRFGMQSCPPFGSVGSSVSGQRTEGELKRVDTIARVRRSFHVQGWSVKMVSLSIRSTARRAEAGPDTSARRVGSP